MIKEHKWKFCRTDEKKVNDLIHKLNIDPLLSKLLISRNIGNCDVNKIQNFINPPDSIIEKVDTIANPTEINKALNRILLAIFKKELIMINGDPDADGITGTAILATGLKYLGVEVKYDFPTRGKEGHGLQPRIIEKAKKLGANLLLTVDCGTKDIAASAFAKNQEIDVIVCDHHVLGHKQPHVFAFINPKTVAHDTPDKKLCGASVALKFIIALSQKVQNPLPYDLYNYLISLACLGTLSDRVSLLEPLNRLIVKKGVEYLNITEREGLKALIRVCIADNIPILTPRIVSKYLVPRLNAPGRIGDPDEQIPDSNIMVDLLLINKGRKNLIKADNLVNKLKNIFNNYNQKESISVNEKVKDLNVVNEERKRMTDHIEDEIELILDNTVNIENEDIIVIKGRNWHSGVIGIDADRLKDRFLKPAILLTQYKNSSYLKASVRSIPTIDMYNFINDISEDFEKENKRKLFCVEIETKTGKHLVNSFGGHAQACGFSIHQDDFAELVKLIKKKASDLSREMFEFTYDVLEELHFEDINPGLVKRFEMVNPFGQGFEEPIFLLRQCQLGAKARPFGNKYQTARTPHVEFTVLPKSADQDLSNSQRLTAVGFSLWKKYNHLKLNLNTKFFDIIFTVEIMKRRRRNRKKKGLVEVIQLVVLDIEKSK